jgi:hypothetical protein
MQKRTMIFSGFILLGCCLALPGASDEKRPTFFFGGQRVYVGMSKHTTRQSPKLRLLNLPPMEPSAFRVKAIPWSDMTESRSRKLLLEGQPP